MTTTNVISLARQRRRGNRVPGAYALHGTIWRPCHVCGATSGELCISPHGATRAVPCLARLKAAAAAEDAGGDT